MRARWAALAAAPLVLLGAGAALVWSGAFDVSAATPHWPVTYWVMDQMRVRSIRVRAANLVPPTGFEAPERVQAAVGHFAEHCATCHGGPGVRRNEAMEGLYPRPPDLARAVTRYSAGELFWILKNGIKMSGMPSMASDGDAMLWDTVAFLRRLPTLTEEDYNDLWMAAQAQLQPGAAGGGMAGMNHGAMPMNHGAPPPEGPGPAGPDPLGAVRPR